MAATRLIAIAMSIVFGLTIGIACGSSNSQPTTATQTDGSLEDDDAYWESQRLLRRVDLEAQAEVTRGDDGVHVVNASMRALDRSDFNEPTLIIDYPAGTRIEVDIIDPIECASDTETRTRCRLMGRWSQRGDIAAPTDWIGLTFTATSTQNTPHEITVTAVSQQNELDNDPNIENNTATVTLNP